MKGKLLLWLMAVLLLAGCMASPAWALADDVAPAQYGTLYQPELRQELQTQALEPRETVLRGKSMLCVGDSIMAGYGLSNKADSWLSMLQSVYGMEITDCSVSGSTLTTSEKREYAPGGCFEPYVERQLPEGDYDLILVEGGGNDWYCAAPLGDSLDSRDPGNFMGAVNLLIDQLREKYPKSVLLFMTPWSPKDRPESELRPEGDYYEAMSQVCAQRGIDCYEARDPAVSGIYANLEDFRETFFLSTTDAWHLNSAGHARFLTRIAQWLEQQTKARVLTAGFLDVKRQNWYSDTVQYAYDQKLMNGMAEDRFGPEENMTRAMLVTVLYRAAGEPELGDILCPFEDVPEDSYYRGAVTWCYQQGMIYGVDDNHFAPDQNITREQMATILYRQSDTSEEPEVGALEVFWDAGDISGYARAPMAWAVSGGILNGMGGGQLLPGGSATRAQVAAMLQRYLERDA